MTVATKTVSKTKTKTVKVTAPKVSKAQQMAEFREREKQRRIEEKTEILERFSTSREIFEQLAQEINTLSQDEDNYDLSVGDDYNYGTEWEIELLLEVLSDLRWFTRYNKDEDDETITKFELDYIRPYFQD